VIGDKKEIDMGEKEIIEWLKKHIEILNKGKSDIERKARCLTSAMWELTEAQHRFKCGKGLPSFDAICIGCDKAKPEYCELCAGNGKPIIPTFVLPGGAIIEFKDVDWSHRDCLEWKRKRLGAACGCGGTMSCVCGFRQAFCFPEEKPKCPFCGREAKVVISDFYNKFDVHKLLKGGSVEK
jgi:hypothetical protein